MSVWYVYIVRCVNGSLYTGSAIDVDRRVAKHNSGKGSKSVVMHGIPVKEVYRERVGPKSTAFKREYAIKQLSRDQKELLINKRGG